MESRVVRFRRCCVVYIYIGALVVEKLIRCRSRSLATLIGIPFIFPAIYKLIKVNHCRDVVLYEKIIIMGQLGVCCLEELRFVSSMLCTSQITCRYFIAEQKKRAVIVES